MGAQRDFPAVAAAGTRGGSLWRRSVAAVSISVLIGCGIHEIWRILWRIPSWLEVRSVLLILGVTLGPASTYAFGYFRCLPEVLGGSGAGQNRTLWQRWSDFARLSIAVAIGITWVACAIATPDADVWEAVETVAGLLGVTCVLLAAVVASGDYLARTMERHETPAGKGWREAVRRLVGRWGAWLIQGLGTKRSLVAGSVMMLLSLSIRMSDKDNKGFEALLGTTHSWITREYSELPVPLNVIVEQGGRWTYRLGLALTVMALASIMAGRVGDALRRSRGMGILGGTLALYGICDFTFAWLRVAHLRPEWLQFGAWIGAWIAPSALWVWRARGDKKQWSYTRLAVMVFYLPIFFVGLSLLVFMASFAPGYYCFVVAMFLLWWGLVRSQWEVARAA
jgi:hypothetical protein